MSRMCSHFGLCGGCRLQNFSYEEELAQKYASVCELFQGYPVMPLLPCRSPWHYRNKMEFSFSESKEGKQFCGLMASRGKVINLEECLLAPEWYTRVLQRVRKWWEQEKWPAYYPPKDRGVLRTLTLRGGVRTQEKMALLTLSGTIPFEALSFDSFLEALLAEEAFDSVVVRRQILAKKQPTRFEEKVLHGKDHIHEIFYQGTSPFVFKIRPSSFFQPNTLQAEQLIHKALTLACLNPSQTLFDLYCGTAVFGICAAGHVKRVWGVEVNPEAIRDAEENVKSNDINNLKLILGDVAACLPSQEKPGVVLIDPPRVGLGEKVCHQISALRPEKILYISCNPVSQAKDVALFLEKGYRVGSIQPVDQFPRTPHIENIVVMDQPL